MGRAAVKFRPLMKTLRLVNTLIERGPVPSFDVRSK
jgi:hypothetical protein